MAQESLILAPLLFIIPAYKLTRLIPLFNSLSDFDFFPRLAIGVTKLDGPDARKFLQGQLTCELDNLTTEQSTLGAHCDAKGKMMASLRLLDNSEVVLALQAFENTQSHLPMLTKYAVFSKVDITDASDEYMVSGFAGKQALAWFNQQYGLALSQVNQAANVEIGSIVVINDSTPRVLVVSTQAQYQALEQALSSVEYKEQSPVLWTALDCRDGLGQIIPATQAEFVPQMQNLQMIDAISFKKGCYIGQETVARMHFRGLNKRGMFVLQSPSHIECKVGDNVEKQLGENWRNAGVVVSIAHVDGQTIACGVLPTDFDLAQQVRIKDNTQGTFAVTKPSYFVE
ncbi:tRNA-modifying protein YgfZ [Psychrobium sp. MM17-31]|uniref:tRNA-modifying protein YgfZ n=1 Tax=Psychrobium sp. MM17-31 TaxID=2917758 RepID=UPI001EF4EBCF|nr:tRNA-modifying protein YgfZ [Psychrobium sp. MM17-31]MCG7533271.1 tRNA-modifying protein YgfZ [Psychrobium sp. MM17-31]